MDISSRWRIDAVSAATDHAHQLFAGRIRRDHEFAMEHTTAGWAFVRITVEPHVRSAAHSPRGCPVTATWPIILTRDRGECVYRYWLSPNPVVRHGESPFYRERGPNAIVAVYSSSVPAPRPTLAETRKGALDMNQRGGVFRSRPRARPETCEAYPGNETRSNRSCPCKSHVVTCAINIGS